MTTHDENLIQRVAVRVSEAAIAMERARQQRDRAVLELTALGLSAVKVEEAVGRWPRTTGPIVSARTVLRIRRASEAKGM